MKKHTNESFDQVLSIIIQEHVESYGVQSLMSIPGFYEIMSEEFNNDVIDRLDRMNEV